MFEQTVANAKAHARIVQIASQKAKSASSILDEINEIAANMKEASKPFLLPDPNTPTSVYENVAFRDLADELEQRRAANGDAETLESIRIWANSKIPTFRKIV